MLSAGQKPTADQLNRLPGQLIAYGRRTTSSTGTTTEQGVLRLDDVPVFAGRRYAIYTGSLLGDSTVAGDGIAALLRYTEDGSTPTTSSTQMQIAQISQPNATIFESGESPYVSYAPASDLLLSVLLTCSRVAGTGTVLFSGASTKPIELFIVDLGEDPGDTATEL